MPSRDPKQRLQDILDNIISEASRRLPDEFKRRHSEIDWRALAGLGNVYRHDYDVVDARLMWLTIHRRLPALEAAAGGELDRLDQSPTQEDQSGRRPQ